MANNQLKHQQSSIQSFIILWLGQATSLLGSQVVQFAFIWWLTIKTGSATILAIASLVALLPQVVLGPFIGVLIDRWPRKLIMLVADGFIAFASLILAYLFFADYVQIWHVFALLFVRAVASGFHQPAMTASTSLMVPERHLTRLQGANQALQSGLMIISAPLGAILLDLFSMQVILGIDIITALFAIIPLIFIYVPQPSKLQDSSPTSFWDDMRIGFQYIWQKSGLMILVCMAAIINLLLMPAVSLMPLLVTEHFGGDALQLGWFNVALGVGSLIGGITLGIWGGFKKRILTVLMGLLSIGGSFILIGFSPANFFAGAMIGMFIIGLGMPFTNGTLIAILQIVVAPDIQGRVFTLLGAISMAMSPLGLIVAGPIADLLGVRIWYVFGGTICFGMGLIGFIVPDLMQIENSTQTIDVQN